MKTVSIVNQKGGVAKTTTSANLGACLAERGARTLLIDMDPQANLTLGLRGEWTDLPYRLHDVLLDPRSFPLEGILRQVEDLPLYLAPGHMDMARAEVMLLSQGGSIYRLRRALQALDEAQPFDWVLIDCPPSLGMLTQNAIVASTHLLIPTEPKFYSFAGMDILNKLVMGLTCDLDLRLELLGVLLTLCDRGTNLSKAVIEEVRERFGSKVFETIIYKNVRLAESEVEGKPIILFDRRSSGAQNYITLAEEVLQRVHK